MQKPLDVLINQAMIPGVSLATLSEDGIIEQKTAGITSNNTQEAVIDSTLFQAASLSKPVFAYIVLKMVEEGKFSRAGETPESGLDRPLHELVDFGPPELREHPNYKLLTPRNLLSHQAGLPNWFKPDEPESYAAKANTRFDYSGLGYCFLNEAVEHIAGKPLDELSRELFDKPPLNMSHSGFVPPPEGSDALIKRAISHSADGTADNRTPSGPIKANPAASLVTTAEEYAKFLRICLNDAFIRRHMFEPQINLAGTDQKAIDAKVPEETLHQLNWGIGMGLQTADNGDTIAFHWGDNETSRAFAAINLRTNKAVACFTNSANGPAIFKQVAEPVIGSIKATAQWLSKRELLPTLPREINPDVRQKTLEILRERFQTTDIEINSAVYLSEPERRNILMRINLTSTSEAVPKSIILKQVLAQTADPDDKQADARFARDWAGLEFTSSVEEEKVAHSTPVFYGSDTAQRFILIEDLGQPHVSLIDSLLSPDQDKAVSALQRYMTTLGRFHATTFGHVDEYTKILTKINKEATTPEQDLASTSDYLLPKIESSIQSLELPTTKTIQDEVSQVLNSTFKPGPFTVLTHGDIAPDNVFDHEGPEGLQLIDFEFCAPRNALLDATYLRMSIPTGWCAKSIPEDVLKPLEQLYRSELAKTVPEASDDLAYSTAYTHACAFHVLHQMANLDSILKKDVLWGSAVLPKYPLWDPSTNSIRSRFLSRLQAFVDVANQHDRLHPEQPPILPAFKKMAEDMLTKVKVLWPKDTKPLDFYPAFTAPSPALQLTQQEPRTSIIGLIPPDSSRTVSKKFKKKLREIKQEEPHYMASTASSEAKEREKPTPLRTTPKAPWKS